MATVSLKNVSIHRAVGESADLSVEIADQEFVVLAGPRGCGNSTVIRLIAGLKETERGDIFIGDRRVNDMPPPDRDVAIVFRDGALYPRMSVRYNLAFGLKQRKFGESEIEKRITDAADILGIAGLLEQRGEGLSCVQRQRVAIARAIARQPKVLLFDEPFADIDSRSRLQMRSEITKLHQRLRVTVIYATDDPTEAMMVADRIVLMNNEVVEQTDTPSRLYEEPANLFVAGFFGAPPMNLVHGTLKQDRETLVFSERDGGTVVARFSASERPGALQFIGKPIVLGVRPESIEVTKTAESRAIGFRALVEIVEPLGAETILHLQTGAHSLICRSRQAIGRLQAGHRMQFDIELQKAHLFDPDSGLRIK